MNSFEMAEQLKGEYKKVFEKADLYGVLEGLNKDVYEDKLMNLYDLLIEAQYEGKAVEKIVGNDLKSFCKEYFKDDEHKKWWVEILGRLFRVMVTLLILEGIELAVALSDGQKLLYTTVDVSAFVYGFIVAYIFDGVVNVVVKPMIFKKKIKPMVYYLGILIIWLFAIVGGWVLFGGYELEIPVLPIVLVSGCYVLVYLLVTMLYRYKKLGRITKLDKEEKRAKKEFDKEISDKYLEKPTVSAMASKFKRINKRYLKKGKGELTQEEFAENVRVEECKMKKFEKWLILFAWGGVIVSAVKEMIINSIFDALIWTAIMGVFIFFACRFLVRTNRESSETRLRVLEECEKLGITIVEYKQRLEE